MREFEVPEDCCLGCGHPLNGARSLKNEHARPGDVTVCSYCGTVMEFGPGMRLLPLSESATKKLMKTSLWKEIIELQWRVGKVI